MDLKRLSKMADTTMEKKVFFSRERKKKQTE